MGDRNKVGQVITNLLENAGKYSPPGSVITVSTVRKGKRVKLFVKDSGKGIPRDQLDRIFERFFRVTGDKQETYSGLGLGLYISSEIVRRHKGNIGVESEENNGSTFYFDLPVHD
jgi:signal transduction histidine kinase